MLTLVCLYFSLLILILLRLGCDDLQEIMKHIISFYTKGRALDSLASFYEACAGVEIDDYQNYEKVRNLCLLGASYLVSGQLVCLFVCLFCLFGILPPPLLPSLLLLTPAWFGPVCGLLCRCQALGALNEALRCMSRAKMKDLELQEQRVSTLQQRIELTQRFVAAKQVAEEDPQEMVAQAQQLLQEPDIEQAVRIGDIYGLIIEHLASKEMYSEAYDQMQELRKRIPNVNVAYYVNMRVIETVHNALNIPLGQGTGPNVGGGDDDEVGEEIEGEDV